MNSNIESDLNSKGSIKKKRGRKPKISNINHIIEEKKMDNSFQVNVDSKMDQKLSDKETELTDNQSSVSDLVDSATNEVKKRRGRKPKNKNSEENNITENVEKKKRGRKPKIKNAEDNVVKVLKKRGRKPKEQVCSANIQKLSSNFNAESENIIIHLPIKNPEINLKSDQLFEYNPDINSPKGFEENIIGTQTDNTLFISQKDNKSYNELCGKGPDPDSSYASYPFDEKQQNIIDFLENDSFESNNHSEEIDANKNNISEDLEVEHDKNWFKDKSDNLDCEKDEKVVNIMDSLIKERKKDIENISILSSKKTVEKCLIQFDQSNNNKSWPCSTSIYCWWCCHPFSCAPCALPCNVKDGIFYVTGIFCSPECAASYNFDDVKSGYDLWERYSLLNYLYRKVYNENNIKIKLAPEKQCLKIFGGNLTIKEFRLSNINYNNSYKIIMPPMISVIPIQEISDIDKGFSSNENKVYLLEREKVNDSELRLKRSTPFNLSNNTLQKCMNISTNKSSEATI